MNFDEQMMQRCIQLASNGLGLTYPNPIVGCVIVHNDRIISEGWHRKAGEPHAEVIAINQVQNQEIFQKATLYVNLEPCSHFGKTPPCSDLIISKQIKQVVIGCKDFNSKVNGQGIQKLQKAGIDVRFGVLEKDCIELNKRFFTFHQKNRPYIILKWAQTANNFMAPEDRSQKWISDLYSKQIVHKWRSEEQAILVGTTTANTDNPQLNLRLWNGNQPVRLVIDKSLKLNSDLHVFDSTQKTIVFSEIEKEDKPNLEFVQVSFDIDLIDSVLKELHQRNIQSVIIEGGKKTLESFIERNLWDEARIFTSNENWAKGIKSPIFQGNLIKTKVIGSDVLHIYRR